MHTNRTRNIIYKRVFAILTYIVTWWVSEPLRYCWTIFVRSRRDTTTDLFWERFSMQASMNFILIFLSVEKHTRVHRAFSASIANPSGNKCCNTQGQCKVNVLLTNTNKNNETIYIYTTQHHLLYTGFQYQNYGFSILNQWRDIFAFSKIFFESETKSFVIEIAKPIHIEAWPFSYVVQTTKCLDHIIAPVCPICLFSVFHHII